MMSKFWWPVVFAFALMFPLIAFANNHTLEDRLGTVAKRVLERTFSDIERNIIGDYFRHSSPDDKYIYGKQGLPPGLAKRETLPPGLQKQVRERGQLPPGLQKKALPDDLLERLPRRERLKRYIIGSDLVLLDESSNQVLDAIEGVIDLADGDDDKGHGHSRHDAEDGKGGPPGHAKNKGKGPKNK